MRNPVGRPKKTVSYNNSGCKFILWLMNSDIQKLEEKSRTENISKAEVLRKLLRTN
jgi:hypothetical protein